MADACEALGLDFIQMRTAIEDGDHLEVIQANQQALDDSGHWGVPSFLLNDEVFFGQDRVATLRWRLEQLGLKK